MSLAPGVRLGPYEILSPLGAGGMGEVWRATDVRVDRAVALKVLPEEFFESEERRQRFGREARLLASLNHPGIATLYSFEEIPSSSSSSRHVLVMELVEGEPLSKKMKAGPISVAEALAIGRDIAAALAAAHAKGIVHRDLKPGNVMVSADGRVKLLDFGLAKALEKEPSASELSHSPTATAASTEAGVILGTAAYMSPEQARGQRVDARTDVWAFGVVLWELLTGTRLFRGQSTPDTLAAVLREPVDFKRLPLTTPRSVRDLLARCLERDADKRLTDIGEARRALERAEAGDGLARAVGVRLAIVAALLLVAAAGGLFLARQRSKPPASPASVAPSIAVLPFANLSGDKEQEYFSDGLTEEVMGLLTRVKDLKVTGRTSSFAFKGKTEDLRAIGQKLNVANLLEGSVRRSGDRLRVSTRLVKVADGYQVWAQTYDRKMVDLFALQDEIAGAVVAALKVRLLALEAARTVRHHTPSLEAHEQYLLARDQFVRSGTGSVQRGRQHLLKAVAFDPDYAAAWSLLGTTDFGLSMVAPTPAGYAEGTKKALALIEKAIALDPQLSNGYAARANLRFNTWDWEGGREDLERALALDPGDSLVGVVQSYFFSCMGQTEEALAASRKILEIEPLYPAAWAGLGDLLSRSGRVLDAKRAYLRAFELSPDLREAHYGLGVTLLSEGDPGAALVEFEKIEEGPQRLMGISLAKSALGRPEAAQKALDALVSGFSAGYAFQIAMVYGRRGEREKAFEWLDRAYVQRDSVSRRSCRRALSTSRPCNPTLGGPRFSGS